MKVLMFGWEFPPHISGGLGTACAGLTYALEREHVKVLFTVPKLHGGESAENIKLINASSIPIRQKKSTHLTARHGEYNLPAASSAYSHKVVARRGSGQTVIEIPSTLAAYTDPSAIGSSFTISQWNYSLESGADEVPATTDRLSAESDTERTTESEVVYVKEPYPFSGTYGKDLLQEVARYSEVAAQIAGEHSFDVIHAHDWMTFPAGIAAKALSGKPLVVHVHATEIDRSGEHVNAAVFAIEKDGMMSADKVITVSNWTKNIAIRHYGIDENKIEVVHNGISPRKSAGASIDSSPALHSPVVTFLGRITHQKGPMYFVDAARKVHRQFPDVHFVVAGSGDQLPQMIERIAQEKLSDRFHFTGFLKGDDIDRIWSISNVYVMPSVSEPFGIAPLEAIQAGVPVILSKQAGVSEVMPHTIKVDFWDTDALAEAICDVLRYKSLANTLKKNGSDELKAITWDKAAKKISTLYYELTTSTQKAKKRSGIILSGSPTPPAPEASLL